jgi:hypothetical protein
VHFLKISEDFQSPARFIVADLPFAPTLRPSIQILAAPLVPDVERFFSFERRQGGNIVVPSPKSRIRYDRCW